ncbi:MAG: hypothetical protein AB8G26_02810 [Ilumatobacter sp.]
MTSTDHRDTHRRHTHGRRVGDLPDEGAARLAACHRRYDDRGQAALLVVVVAATLLTAIIAALSMIGTQLIDERRAQTAADAAALAALAGGRSAAAEFAERHGATLVSWESGPGPQEVTVVVSVGASSATARATDAP